MCISGHFVTALADVTKNYAVFLTKASLRILKRIFGNARSYSSKIFWMTDIIVQGDDKDGSFAEEKLISIWFAEALAFSRFHLDAVRNGPSAKKTRKKLKQAESKKDYCFIQYYHVLPKNIVSLDRIDKLSAT